MKILAIIFLSLATAFGAVAALPVQTTFTGPKSEHAWPLSELGTNLPSDWTPYEFLVVEFKASSSQRFDLGLKTSGGEYSKRIGPFAGVWVRAAIPLRFYRKPAGDGADLAATFNQPRSSYWINIHTGAVGPTTNVNAITVTMEDPVGSPTLEIRSVALATNDPGDAVLEGKPLIDEFGQYTHADWPDKVKSLADLKNAWAAEANELKNAPSNRCAYGGFLGTSAKATGYFRDRESGWALVVRGPGRAFVLFERRERRRDFFRHTRAGARGFVCAIAAGKCGRAGPVRAAGGFVLYVEFGTAVR